MEGKSNTETKYRQLYIAYAQKHTVAETARRYRISRKTVHKWLKRWDGTRESLESRSRRPHSSPRQHTDEELRSIRRRKKQCGWQDIVQAYQLSVERDGYSRSYGSYKNMAMKLKGAKGKKKKTRKPKPYQRAEYIGQKVQMDVKHVPTECIVNGRKYYQFTAVDECSRWTYREMYEEQSTYSAKNFLMKLITHAPFPIRMIQTDNGTEFTNSLMVVKAKHKTLFEQALLDMGIEYHRIRIATPRHNGKVERQHRIDGERFYSKLRMFSREDGRKQLADYQRRSNKIWKPCLGMKSPNQVVEQYLGVM